MFLSFPRACLARARKTEQEIEQDRNCHYDLQSSIIASPSGRGRRASSRAGEGSATPVRALTRASTVPQKLRPGTAYAAPGLACSQSRSRLRCPAGTRHVPRHDLLRDRFEDRGVSSLEIDRVAHHDIGGAAARGHFLESCRQIVGFDLIKGEIFVSLLVVAHLCVGQAKALSAYESRYVEHVGYMLLVVPFVVLGFFAGNRVGQHYKCISWHCHSPLFDSGVRDDAGYIDSDRALRSRL